MTAAAVRYLDGIAAELAEIHRAKHYGLWRDEARHRVDRELASLAPFADYALCWIFTGDGGGTIVGGRYGAWAIDRLVEKQTPEAILALFEAEIRRNSAVYAEVCPVFGIEIEAECVLADGIKLIPPPADFFGNLEQPWRFNRPLPTGACALVQSYTVTPAFEVRDSMANTPAASDSETVPPMHAREAVRARVRLACLLSSPGAVEMPISIFQPDRTTLFVAGEGNQAGRPFAAHPLVSFPADGAAIKRAFDQLDRFADLDSLSRAIDRLGRARLATSSVDRALDLGMAAEIALMHDQGSSNSEITFKLSSRAGWLLGNDVGERTAIFNEMKQLYGARSAAVHTGVLSAKSKLDLDSADQLVTRVLGAILDSGGFPEWTSLTMGAE